MKQASVSSTDQGGGKRRAAGMDVIAPPPLGSSGLAVDGTGSASGYPPIASPSLPMSPSVRPLVGAIGRENESRASVESMRATPL
jgi:hypothetical protein